MLTIDEIEVLERDAKDEYVDEYGAGSYSPEISKLCADWRELQAQLQASKQDYEDMREAWKEDEKRITALTDERDAVRKALLDHAKSRYGVSREYNSETFALEDKLFAEYENAQGA